jgi:hypothetical protein
LDASELMPLREARANVHLDRRGADHLADVGPGGEDAVAAGDDDRADQAVVIEPGEVIDKIGEQRVRERVSHAGTVDLEYRHCTQPGNEQLPFVPNLSPCQLIAASRRRRHAHLPFRRAWQIDFALDPLW